MNPRIRQILSLQIFPFGSFGKDASESERRHSEALRKELLLKPDRNPHKNVRRALRREGNVTAAITLISWFFLSSCPWLRLKIHQQQALSIVTPSLQQLTLKDLTQTGAKVPNCFIWEPLQSNWIDFIEEKKREGGGSPFSPRLDPAREQTGSVLTK